MNKFRLDKDNCVFIFIDIQDKLFDHVFNGEEVIENAKTLAKAASILNIPKVVTVQYRKGLGGTNEGLNEELKDATEIEKISFSCMLNDEFKETVKDFGKKQAVVVGGEAHICCWQTIRDLLEEGYQVFAPIEGVGSRFEKNYKSALDLYRDMGAVVTNTEAIIFDLCKVAGTDEFKQLQKLVK